MKRLLVSLTLLALTACGVNPIKEAQTLEQKSYASYGTFVVYEEQAAKLVLDPAVPVSVKDVLRTADKAAKPVADSLLDAALQVSFMRAMLEVGETAEEQLAIAVASLNQWYLDSRPKIVALVDAVKGVQ